MQVSQFGRCVYGFTAAWILPDAETNYSRAAQFCATLALSAVPCMELLRHLGESLYCPLRSTDVSLN